MKILYAIQGTGNGHLSRAHDILPELQKYGNVDIVISGTDSELHLQHTIKYRYHGLGFFFGKHGGINILKTAFKLRLFRFIKDVLSLPVHSYDIVINDFEPITSWACKIRKKPCISLSHQTAVLKKTSPQSRVKNIQHLLGKFILKHYAPSTYKYGFHFKPYDDLTFTPIIRKEIRNHPNINLGHYSVYLPAYSDEFLITFFQNIPTITWHIFSKRTHTKQSHTNVTLFPVSDSTFINSLCSSAGVICGAGFETPAEALYLGKKLFIIPMTGQYEQACNATALESIGIPTIPKLQKEDTDLIKAWSMLYDGIQIPYPDNTSETVQKIINHTHYQIAYGVS
ncbi:MAG: glycosyltransferase family protein [Bacteroidota bacterium]